MGLRESIVRTFVRLGIGLVDLLILGLALVYIYLSSTPADSIGIITVDAMIILLTVIVLYLAIVIVVSLFLTYMREDNSLAKAVKGFVSTLLVMTLFNLFIFPTMWILGYELSANVQQTLIIAAVVRLLAKIFLHRLLGRYFV